MVTSTKHRQVDSDLSIQYTTDVSSSQNHNYNSYETHYYSIQCSMLLLLLQFPLVCLHQFLTSYNVLQLASQSKKIKIHQILIAQRQQHFQYRMRPPSCRNTHQASTQLCNVSQNFITERLRGCFVYNCPLFNTRLETNHEVSSWQLPDNCRSESSGHRDHISCN